MEVGDTVTKVSDATFRGTVVQLPRSIGRSRPRAQIASVNGNEWLHVDELLPAPKETDE